MHYKPYTGCSELPAQTSGNGWVVKHKQKMSITHGSIVYHILLGFPSIRLCMFSTTEIVSEPQFIVVLILGTIICLIKGHFQKYIEQL